MASRTVLQIARAISRSLADLGLALLDVFSDLFKRVETSMGKVPPDHLRQFVWDRGKCTETVMFDYARGLLGPPSVWRFGTHEQSEFGVARHGRKSEARRVRMQLRRQRRTIVEDNAPPPDATCPSFVRVCARRRTVKGRDRYSVNSSSSGAVGCSFDIALRMLRKLNHGLALLFRSFRSLMFAVVVGLPFVRNMPEHPEVVSEMS